MNLIKRICDKCGKKFEIERWRLKWSKHKYCSRSCANSATATLGTKNPLYKARSKVKCLWCGKEFETKTCRLKTGRGKYCSRSCSAKTKTVGDRNYFWRGGRTINSGGYIEVKAHFHPFKTQRGYVREHILVVEQHLNQHEPNSNWLIKLGDNKYLNPNVTVHHVDGNRKNNKIENLYVFDSNNEHSKYETNLRYGNVGKLTKSNIGGLKNDKKST